MGAVIRTAAENKEEVDIKEDIQFLQKTWNKILNNECNEIGLIYSMDSLIRRILIDLTGKNVTKIIVDNEDDYEFVKKIVNELERNIDVVIDKKVYEKYNVEKVLSKIKQKKIWLKCGGFIVIEKTEALTAIDVNSGKYIGKDSLDKTAFKVNKEATQEIAKQIRLRDISGIIVIDYIDMKSEQDKKQLRDFLVEELKKDRSRVGIYDFTKLNLLEITRKKMYSGNLRYTILI